MLYSRYINLNKLDKDKDVTKKGNVNLTIAINDKTDEYGNNAALWLNQTKEQREAGEPRNYVGNAKVVFIDPSKVIEVAERKEFVSNAAQNPSSAPAQSEEKSGDLPF